MEELLAWTGLDTVFDIDRFIVSSNVALSVIKSN